MKIYFFTAIICFAFMNCKYEKDVDQIIFKETNVTDKYFGKEYSDSFQYIENLKDSIVIKLLGRQNERAKKYITGLKYYENLLEKQNTFKSVNVRINNIVITKDNQYFYLKQDTNESFPMLYKRQGLKGEETLLYNPKNFRPETKENYLITYLNPSRDGKKVALSLTKNDEEIAEIIIIDVDSKKVLPQIISNTSPSNLGGISWLPDNTGFTFTHVPDIDKNSMDFYKNTAAVLYMLNDDPENIKILLSKENNPELDITSADFPIVHCAIENNNYLVARIARTLIYDDYYYANFNKTPEKIKWRSLFKEENMVKAFLLDSNNIYYLLGKNASNLKLCKTSISKPDFQNPNVLVEEDPDEVINNFVLTKDGIFFTRTKNGVEANLYRYFNHNVEKIEIPNKSGSILLYSKGYTHEDLWIETKGWTNNRSRYRFDSKTSEFKEDNLYTVTKFEGMENCIVEEIEVASHDGVMVPLSIIYKEGTKLNGKTPLFIGGYGCYGISFVPSLSSRLYQWVSEGGIFAVAHVRGGGEKGDTWHKGGYKATKANTWQDFNACTEYLIKNKYSNPEKIVAWSASAGGILIGRAITEKPNLYKAAIIGKGLLNTMRSEYGRNGDNFIVEFGTVKDSVSIQYVYEMDAYHHIKKGGNYPAIYLTAGMNDARVPAWQPAKFVAKMQMLNPDNITLLSVDFEGGHGFTALTSKENEEIAKMMAFAFWQVGHPDYQLKRELE